MILWTLLYLSFGSSFVLPTPSDISPSLLAHDADKFGTRSIWSIIWSCFSTIFACTWIAVHPNIPAPKDSQWAVLRRRLAIMGYVLITPEMVILWAARQNFAAKHFAKRHQSRGWTMVHAFFVIMGGFTLHDKQGTPLRILGPNELGRLAGRIKWPSITEAEIQDRSKGDHLSKAIVLIQTSWFITQCIVRGAYRLEVTELEVTTLAYAVLTGVIYYLWWNKPLDVRCSVPVYLLEDDEEVIVTSNLEPHSQEPHLSSHNNSTSSPQFQSTRMQHFSAFIQRQCQTVLGLAYVLFLYPLFSFFRAFGRMYVSHSLDHSTPLRVPTFYSPKFTYYTPYDRALSIAMCVAVIFGGIHCVAWSFHFPTFQEELAWRISAASIAGLPILIWVFVLLTFFIDIPSDNWHNIVKSVSMFLTITSLTSYVIARIVLLVLPCIALRALNPAALVEIQWAAFFPHIG